MSCAVRRPRWRVRLRHWIRHEGPAHYAAARDTLLTILVLAGTGVVCFFLLGLGV